MEALSNVMRKAYNDRLATTNQIKSLHPDNDSTALDDALAKFEKDIKDSIIITNLRFGVSCWYQGDEENDAMWKLYSSSGQGIAVESTVKQLREACINDKLVIDAVRYLNFDNAPIEKGHRHYGLFQKRKSFEHERELRATVLLSEKDYGKGKMVKCDLNILMNKIHVSPLLEAYVKDDIEKLCSGKIKRLAKPVLYSPLLTKPDYGIDII